MGKFGGTFDKEIVHVETIRRWKEGNKQPSFPFADADAVFPETDPRFERLKERRSKEINESISYRGVVLDCKFPHFHWSVAMFADGRDIPSCLTSSYTNKERILSAIDDYLQREKEGNEASKD